MNLLVLIVIAAISFGLVVLAKKLPGNWPILIYVILIAIGVLYLLALTGLLSSPIVLRS